MSPLIGGGFLLAYYLLMIEIALATHAVGTFRISFWKFGPTELRILLAIGTLRLMQSDIVTIAGNSTTCCSTSAASSRSSGWCVTFLVSAITNTRALYAPSRCQTVRRQQIRTAHDGRSNTGHAEPEFIPTWSPGRGGKP